MAPAKDSPLRFARSLEHPADYTVEIPLGDQLFSVAIPKGAAANRAWRRELLMSAAEDEQRQRTLKLLCSAHCADACLFWLNAFGWTFAQQRIEDDGRQHAITSGGVDVPFITWVCQDHVIRELIDAIETGRDVAVDKSRDMGMTWLIIAVFVWYWLFRPGTNFMAMSYVEDLVDNAGDPDTILWKVDYLVQSLPDWMVPALSRTHLRLVRQDGQATIIGKSTTGKKGRGGRKTAALFDEAGFMDALKQVWISAGQTTSCRIANSTAAGPGFFSKLVRDPRVQCIRLPWWDHPLKGRGRYEWKDPETGIVKIRSPWYDLQVAKAVDQLEIDQELDMDHSGAGFTFFDDRVIARHVQTNCSEPIYQGDLSFTGDFERDIALRRRQVEHFNFADAAGGPLSLWCDLEEDEHGNWRPPQHRTYVVGIDISHGRGRSNSVGSIKDLETEEQVGEWASGRVAPEEFARQMVALGYWLGGARGCAFMAWEANGPGGIFGDQVMKLRYPWVYYLIDERRTAKQRTDVYGWHSNPQRKKDMLGLWRGALARNEYIPRSVRMLGEAAEYVFLDDGGVGPAELKEESGDAKATHGDRVIAGALSHYAGMYAHRCRPPERIALPGSPAFRRARRQEREAKGRR